MRHQTEESISGHTSHIVPSCTLPPAENYDMSDNEDSAGEDEDVQPRKGPSKPVGVCAKMLMGVRAIMLMGGAGEAALHTHRSLSWPRCPGVPRRVL